ncbi:MAG: hypothetical protein HY828_22160 [Actinobacteria bacterium]|nr:hypothetical protein [Actinomycetota bacterium]
MPATHYPGARWVKAALQINPFSYIGRSAPSKTFADAAAYDKAILDECVAQGVELIAVTDHWCVDSALSLVEAATARGVVALPGFEANSAEGVHLLVLFEAGTSFADVNAAIGVCGGSPGCANGTTGQPYKDILRAMDERGALVIPAHVNVANGGMLTSRTGPPLQNMVTNPALHAIAVSPAQPDAPDQEAVCKGRRPYERTHPLAVIHADDVCNPSALRQPGASSWFKVSSLRLDSIKLAVRTPSTRVAVADPAATPRALIRRISWTGGFLDGVVIPVSPDLTALIGGRGTGKSTVIESLRYALDIEPMGTDARRDHNLMVTGVLRSGTTVRVEVETTAPAPQYYVIERSVPNPPLVRDSSGAPTKLRSEDVLGLVEIFGQHELAELAHDKASVASMLRRFAGTAGPSPDEVRVRGALAENRRKLAGAEKSRDELEAELADIPRLQQDVDRYKATNLPTRLAELKQLQTDESLFIEGSSRVYAAEILVSPVFDDVAVSALVAALPDVSASSEQVTLGRVSSAMVKLHQQLADAAASVASAFGDATKEIAAAQAHWRTATDPQREGHNEVLRQLVAEGHNPDQYLTTTKALETLRAKEQQRSTIATAIASLQTERAGLLGELDATERERAEHLNEAVRRANASTSGAVIVRPVAAPDRSGIKKVVERHVRGTRTLITAAIDVDDFSPRAFAAAARNGVPELEARFGVRGAQAAGVVAAGEALFRELEELSVGQAVDVRLDISAGSGARDYRSLDDLSKGQRATALLLLLLGASSAPLIIDQPEDDLDNRFVYEGVVRRLRELKGTRQIIASTHNANVPVLGDAELIVALEGDGQHGRPVVDGIGSLDDAPVRALAENLLEGGPAAFNARQHLYGF